mgnify:CR=1 FL=1
MVRIIFLIDGNFNNNYYAFIIALLISIFDILPVLGTGGIMIPWAIISLIMGNIKMGILLAIVYIVRRIL